MDNTAARIRTHFLGQAEGCEALGSPFTALLCRILAETLDRSMTTGRRIFDWPGEPRDAALAIRLCAALHRLVLAGMDPDLQASYPPNLTDEARLRAALAAAFYRFDAYLAAALGSAPQTNEIARSAMLYPGFVAIARIVETPLRLFEIGSSAGLNLQLDRFHYTYGETNAGDPSSPVRLAPEVRGMPPPLAGDLRIIARLGSDIAPVDISDEEQRLRLRSFVWADQVARLERLDAAIGLAREKPISVVSASAGDFVERALASREPGATLVLFHSIMWQYLPLEERTRIEAALNSADRSAESPVAWLRMEPLDTQQSHARLTLTMWPDGETRHLANCDYHGRWIEWLGI